MNFPYGERGFEIVTGPGKIAQEKFKLFAQEYRHNITIDSPEPGKLIVTLKQDTGEPVTTVEDYQIFLNQFLLLDDRFILFKEGMDSKWTIRILESDSGPYIEAYYL